MQILISVIINIIILAVALPLFYIYIVSRARERLERETTSKAREEIEALVKEFNNIALNRISILEDAINRANELLKKMNIDNQNNNIEENSEYNINSLNIKIEDSKKLENLDNNDNNTKEIEIKNTISNNKEFNNRLNKNGLNKETREELREELRNKLDLAIKKNLHNKNNENKAEDKNNEKNDETEIKKTNNENIIKLYREGFSKEQISKKLNCAMTEIDIVIDMENINK